MPIEQSTVASFKPLGDYKAPSLPAADTLQLLGERLRLLFSKPDDKPFIADDRLHRSTLKMLDEVVAPPACGPLLEELQATLEGWVTQREPLSWLKLIVLPPGDENGVVETWASAQGHEILPPPDRSDLISAAGVELPKLTDEGVLVIPQLERWFLRHRNGLHAVRQLLAELDVTKRHCLVSCNSWAWAFLCKAVGADLILPDALTFEAYDAERLHGWFSQLSEASTHTDLRFRLTQNGEDVMMLKGEDKDAHEYFTRLAARSLGIPWVAWRLWRRSLRSSSDDDEADSEVKAVAQDDGHTLWVSALEEFSLPGGAHNEAALLVLHAILIHGAITLEELRAVLPLVGESNILSALISAGLVERKDRQVTCFPAAYPAIRSGLATAGFSMDKL